MVPCGDWIDTVRVQWLSEICAWYDFFLKFVHDMVYFNNMILTANDKTSTANDMNWIWEWYNMSSYDMVLTANNILTRIDIEW